MKAAIYAAAGKPLVIEERPDPTPGNGQVVIKVARCGICGSDTHMTSGSPFDFPLGAALGHEYAGEVVAVGRGVKHLREGDRITALPMMGCGSCLACLQGNLLRCSSLQQMMGGFGEYTLVAENSAIKLPSSLSMNDGALVEPLACGLHAVRLAQIQPGDDILVIGAGPIGLAVVYWARRLGAWQITVTARSEVRRDIALVMGATRFVTSNDLQQHPMAPVDAVFECSGAPETLNQAIDAVTVGGTVMSAGMCSHPEPILPILANFKESKLLFAIAYTVQEFLLAVDSLDAGHVEPRAMITDIIGLNHLPEQLEAMRQSHPQCKVLVDPWCQHDETLIG